MKIIVTLVLISCLSSSTFAQRGSRQQPQQTSDALVGERGLIALPTRNDASGIAAKNAFGAVQNILYASVVSNPFNVTQPTKEERQIQWQRALDTIETLAVFVNPSAEAESPAVPEVQSGEQPDVQPNVFTPDPLVSAHYFLGKGMIYQEKVSSRLFTQDSATIFAKLAVDNFNAFIQTGAVQNSSFVYGWLPSLYFDFLNDPNNALLYLNKDIAVHPRNTFLFVTKSRILLSLGRTAEACETLKQANALGEEPVVIGMMRSIGCQ